MQNHGKFLYLDNSGEIRHPTAPAPANDPAETLADTQEALHQLIKAITDNGMNPLPQLLGYFTTEDPTYLPEGANARNLAHRIGRDKLLSAILITYMQQNETEVSS